VPGGPVAAGPGFGGLDEQIDRLDTAVGEPGIERIDVLGTSAMNLKRIGKLGHDLSFSPFAGIEPTRGIEIVKQAHVIVSTPRGGLDETNRGDGREVLLGVRLIDVMIEGAPDAPVADAR